MFGLHLSPPQMLAFLIVLIAGSIAAGYVARRLGLSSRIARVLMWFYMLVPYTVVSFLAIWALKFRLELTALPLFGMILLVTGIAAAAAVARALKMPPAVAGAFVLATGASNLGFTMGGFVNFAIFGEQGLAVAQMYTLYWEFGMVLVLYPVARTYGHGTRIPLLKLLLANLRDPRSLPLVAALIGLCLNLVGVHRPDAIRDWHVVDVLMIVGAIGAFFVTGLRLHFEHLALHARLYPIVAAVKFVLTPAVGLLLVGFMWLIGLPLIHPAEAPAWKVLLVQASTPSAIYAVVISNLFNLDDRVASIIFVVNTAMYLAIVLPIVVMIFG